MSSTRVELGVRKGEPIVGRSHATEVGRVDRTLAMGLELLIDAPRVVPGEAELGDVSPAHARKSRILVSWLRGCPMARAIPSKMGTTRCSTRGSVPSTGAGGDHRAAVYGQTLVPANCRMSRPECRGRTHAVDLSPGRRALPTQP
jgi:hypothetical protein